MVKILTSLDELPAGARKVHLYSPFHLLRPRGTMEKESVSLALAERLKATFESWTSPAYGDSMDPEVVVGLLFENLDQEVAAAKAELLKVLDERKLKEATGTK